MIKGLYETHLFVENLERSIDFYKTICNKQNTKRKSTSSRPGATQKRSYYGNFKKPHREYKKKTG